MKADALRTGANALRFKGNVFNSGADILDNTANGFSPVRGQQLRAPQTSAQLNFLNAFGGAGIGSSYNRPSYNPPGNNINNNNVDDVITINNQGPFNSNRDPDVIGGAGDPRAVTPELLRAAKQMWRQEQQLSALTLRGSGGMRLKDAGPGGPKIRQCEERFTQLVGDIFIGNEMVPDVIETPPKYPLELTYRSH